MSNREHTNAVDELDAMTQRGEILQALAKFYAEECTFQEGNEEPIRGRQTQHERLSKMFAGLQSFDGATLHGTAIRGDHSLSEFSFRMTGGDGAKIVWNEVLVRRWRNGKVVAERFYQA